MVSAIQLGAELSKGSIFFALGFILGYVVRGYKEKFNSTIDNEKFIALLVSLIWAISVIVDMLNPVYDTPIALHGLMGAIVGFYYKRIFDKKQ